MAQTSTLSDLIIAPHHTALSVQDFVAARDFFVKVLGLTLEGETGAPTSRRWLRCRRLYPLDDARSQPLLSRAIQILHARR